MSRLIPKFLRKPVDLDIDPWASYGFKTKFSMLGPVMSGKSTIAAGLVYICQTLSALTPNFYAKVLDASTQISSDANNLRLGRFPEKTNPLAPRGPQAGLVICERGYKDKKVHVPICDVAGEITDHIVARSRSMSMTPSERIKQDIEKVNLDVVRAVKDSQGFIVALSAEDALMFRDKPSSLDPDVYCASVLNTVMEYRRRNRLKPVYAAVVITKWDKVMEKAKMIGMDVYDQHGGLERFLANGFPNTNMLLKPLIEQNRVRFFKSYFQIAKDSEGNIQYWPGTDSPKIKLLDQPEDFIRYKPECSEKEYAKLVKWIGSFAK